MEGMLVLLLASFTGKISAKLRTLDKTEFTIDDFQKIAFETSLEFAKEMGDVKPPENKSNIGLVN